MRAGQRTAFLAVLLVACAVAAAIVLWPRPWNTTPSEAPAPPPSFSDDVNIRASANADRARQEVVEETSAHAVCMIVDDQGSYREVSSGYLVVRGPHALRALEIKNGRAAIDDEGLGSLVVHMTEGRRTLELVTPGILTGGETFVGRFCDRQLLHVSDAESGLELEGVTVWESRSSPAPGEPRTARPEAATLLAERAASPLDLPAEDRWVYVFVEVPGYGGVGQLIDRGTPTAKLWLTRAGSLRVSVTTELHRLLQRNESTRARLELKSNLAPTKSAEIAPDGVNEFAGLTPGIYGLSATSYGVRDARFLTAAFASVEIVSGQTSEVALDVPHWQHLHNLEVILAADKDELGGEVAVGLYVAEYPGAPLHKWGQLSRVDFTPITPETLSARVACPWRGQIVAIEGRTGMWSESNVGSLGAEATLVLDLSTRISHTIDVGGSCAEETGWLRFRYVDGPSIGVAPIRLAPGTRRITINVVPLPISVAVQRGRCFVAETYMDPLNSLGETQLQLADIVDAEWRTLQLWFADQPLNSAPDVWFGLTLVDDLSGREVGSEREYTFPRPGRLSTDGTLAPGAVCRVRLSQGRYRVVLNGLIIGHFQVFPYDERVCVEITGVADVAALLR